MMAQITRGRRRDLVERSWAEGEGPQPGDYGKEPDGHWYGVTPTGLTGNLSAHEVTEHEDGTITVSPSILVDDMRERNWHGYLERGFWRSVG